MICESASVVSALLALEQQLVGLRRHSEQLMAASGSGRFAPAVAATGNLRRGFENLAVTVTNLRAYVVAADGAVLGGTVESLGELTIRAATMVVAAQLGQLTDAIHREAAHPRTRALFVGRLRGIDEVAAFLRDELCRINESWARHRHDEAAAPAGADAPRTQRHVGYRRAVREAQHAVVALGRDPDVAHFLREGAMRRDWPQVHAACTEIAAVLKIRLDTELDRRLFDARPAPARARGGIPTVGP
jgi:hypothetical protein